ncbi:MAG: hypothetical protein WD898_00285 [Candidatus Paceibacterota bacterium]
MEKITLKPSVKELLYKADEPNIHFDVLSYQGTTNQEKNLGSLFVIGHVKFSENEDLAYMVSLISSLARREYFSESSLKEQDPKKAFSRTLKKLNEVLVDFFKNKDFKLNIGLASIVGDNIYISRLGKFKIDLARNHKFIDILNNIELFNKDTENEEQFSNIISGKLEPKDKLFAYFPTRSITSRGKVLNGIFVNDNQDEFVQKITNLASNANTFSCCGFHIAMQEVKEIALETIPQYSMPIAAQTASVTGPGLDNEEDEEEKSDDLQEPEETDEDENEEDDSAEEDEDEEMSFTPPQEVRQPHIIPSEVSMTKRGNVFTPLVSQMGKLKSLGKMQRGSQLRFFISITAIIVVTLTALIWLKSAGPSQEGDALELANNNLKLAQSHLNQGNSKDARFVLQAALSNVSGFSNKKIDNLRDEIDRTLSDLDRVSTQEPSLFYGPENEDGLAEYSFLTSLGSDVVVVNPSGKSYSVTSAGVTELSELSATPQYLLSDETSVSSLNSLGEFSTFDIGSGKRSSHTLKELPSISDASLYQDNLYVLSENTIYKYTDVTAGGTGRTQWVNDLTIGNLVSLTIDGNIYALNDSGKLITYFKGEKQKEVDLAVKPAVGSKIFTAPDLAFIYLADKSNKKVYVFDKTNGSLKTSYRLDVVGSIKDIDITPNGHIWILSGDNKIWQLQP